MRFSAGLLLAAMASLAVSVSAQANPPNRNPTSTTSVASATSSAVSIEPSPTGKTCTLHVDHWHCEEDEEDGTEISEESGEGCVQHGTHWHCPAGVSAPCTAVLTDYNLGLHIVALFVLLIASGFGVFLPPMLGQKARMNNTVNNLFFVLRHFGSGVIISTAFIHLLMHAFVMFSNECLGHLAYEAVAPAIAMASLMVIFSIDFIGSRIMAKKSDAEADSRSGSELGSESPAEKNDHEKLGHDHSFSHVEANSIVADGATRRAHWEVQLLEAGIIFHSIMIGCTLGAQGGSGFIPTFCAIVFHQLFEGLGLGARIARLEYRDGKSWKRWILCAAYALTTPVGIAIGIGVRGSFNLSGDHTILSIGILDSISAGILLYTGIAQLLVGDWLAGEMKRASTTRVLLGAFSLFLGLFAMSLIGKWA